MKFLFTLLLFAGAQVCHAGSSAPAASEINAEIDETGGAHVTGDIEHGDLTCRIALNRHDRLQIDAFYLRHPVLSVGFLKRGELFRLLNSPAGSWNRISAGRLFSSAKAGEGKAAPEEYGVVLSLAGKNVSFFSFFEPDNSVCGSYVHLNYGAPSFEFLATFSQPLAPRQPEEWLLETPIVRGRTLLHVLWRLSAEYGPIHFTGGAAVSSARCTVPQVAGSAVIEIKAPYAAISAGISGGMRHYFTIDRRPGSVPLAGTWRLAAGKMLPFSAFIEHSIEVETLPLIHIPFRATKESVRFGFGFESDLLAVKGMSRLRMRTNRSAEQDLSVYGELAVSALFKAGRVAVTGEVTWKDGMPLQWALSLPAKLHTDSFRFSADATLSREESYRIELSTEVTVGEKTDLQWYVSAEVAIPVPQTAAYGTPGSAVPAWAGILAEGVPPPAAEPAGGAVEFGYRIGWRVKR